MNKKKIINDPVYGFITLPSELVYDIISHPYFQRLRHIKQLGLTEFVYPAALHSRFQHALGAMHLMGKVLDTLRSKGVEISNDEYQAAQLAVLLHDVGHIIDHDDHLRFASAFGAPTPAHPLFDAISDPNYPTIYPIFRDRFKARYGGSRGFDKPNWHADVTAAVNPPAASILRAEVIPPYGGDTQWSNTVAAYAGLLRLMSCGRTVSKCSG